MAKDINLTSEKWIDMIFEGKNKNYGAYVLRKTSPKRHAFAFLYVLAGTIAIILISMGVTQYNKIRAAREAMTEVSQLSNIKLDKPETPEEDIQKKFEAPPPVELKNTIQYTVPTIKDDKDVPEDKEIKTQDELQETNTQISIKDVTTGNDDTGVDIATLNDHKAIVQDEPKEDNTIHDLVTVEQPPSFPGGDAAMYAYLNSHINYPAIASENNIQGKVVCQFVVGKDGSIENVTVARSGPDPSLDKEAVRVIKSMPKWIPGKQGGNAVKVRFTLPVVFKLNNP